MLKEIREYYDLSQPNFANHLMISRSRLSMIENNKRDYPKGMLTGLRPLYDAISQPVEKQTDEKLGGELVKQQEKLLNWIDNRKGDCEHKLVLLERKLATMKERQVRSLQIIETVPALKATAKPGLLKLYIFIEQHARTTQQDTTKISQLKLELQVLHLKTEIEYLNTYGQ